MTSNFWLLTSKLIGPLLGGLSIWCAAGDLTVASAASSDIRLAVPASWWVFVFAVAVSAMLPAWRRDPKLVAPALLATLPWWPVPLPAIALIWTGPLAWLPIALAVGLGIGWPPRRWPRGTYVSFSPILHTSLAAALTLVAGLGTAWAVAPRVPGGDELHYLIITESLLKDGDLRIQNNHDNRDYASFYGGELRPDRIQLGRNGVVYSIHAPGVSTLVLPGYAAFGYRGAQATIVMLAAIAAALVWQIGFGATSDKRAAWFAWAAVVLSPTFLVHAVTVFPDGPGALAVAAGVWLLVKLSRASQDVSRRALLVVSILLAALPWLHTRFAVIAAGLGLLVVWRMLADRERPLALRRARVVIFAAVPAASAIAWFAFFYVLYGTPNPAAPYGGTAEASLRFIPGGLAGLLFDQQFGLLTYTPVLIAALVGVFSKSAARVGARSIGAAALLYLMAVAIYWMWWAGNPSAPARFATAALPVLALLAALAWREAGPARAAWHVLLAACAGVAVVVIGIDHGSLAWNMRDGQARWLEWLGPVVNLPRGFPSFFWRLNPESLSTEWPFVLHAGVFAGVLVLVWQVFRLAGRRTAYAGVWWLAAALMAAVQAGWWLNGEAGLDPARSQLGALGAVSRGAAGLRIGPLSLRRFSVHDALGEFVITGEEPGLTAGGPWLVLNDVPPGTYELRFITPRPREGTVALRIGRTPRPLATFALLPLSDQGQRVVLPAGAASLTIEPDDALRAVGGRVEMTPVVVDPAPARLARSATRYGPLDVFFLDEAIFAEPEGFWVRGGGTAELVLVTRVPNASIEVLFRNGAARNQVAIDLGRQSRRVAMAPGEELTLTMSVEDPTGVARLRVTSAAGFRPSEVSQSRDARYLGVWVSVR